MEPITIKCNKCGEIVTHPFPLLIPLKHALGSAIFLPHENGVDCPKCGMHYAPLMVQAQIAFTLAEAEKPPTAPKIIGVNRPLRAN